MAEQPLNNSTEDDKSAAQSNIEVGDINVGGNVYGHIIVGHGNIINMSPEQQIFRSLHQLPQPPADFTGREELIAQLLADFEKGKGATITGLTGMGGIGKTALGLVVAHQLKKDYPDAQIFLDLKGTTVPLSAMDVMRHVVLSFEPGMDLRTLDEAGMGNAYQSVLHGKRVLLYFDNARSAEQIAPLRPPETCVLLVTSRWVFSVPGLHPHRLDVMSQENAEKFLLELCPRIGSKSGELAKACAYLPLALRIAGSFLGVNEHWNVEKYITQLSDRKRRLTTLKQSRTGAELTTEPELLAIFEFSYNQLSEENQNLWRMLGVFPTSFDISAVGAMWELNPEEDEAATVLGLFLRHSLLDYDEISSRYSLHDLLGDYALAQVSNEEKHEAHLRHASHYKDVLSLADDLYQEGGERITLGLRLFDLEWENIRAGQAWVSLNSDDKDCLELCNEFPSAGYMILSLKLHPGEWIAWSVKGLEAARRLGKRENEGYHLNHLGNAHSDLADLPKAIEYYQQALAISRELNDRRGEGNDLGNLGIVYKDLGDMQTAIEYYQQALAIAREIGDRSGKGAALSNLGFAYYTLGNPREAIKYHRQALAIARKLGDRYREGAALGNLGNAYYSLGKARNSMKYYKQALAIAHEIDDRRNEGRWLGNLGVLLADLGETPKAIEFYEGHLAIAHEIGDRYGEGAALRNLGNAYYSLGEARKAIEFYEQDLAIAREIDDRRGEGNALFNISLALYDLEENDRAIDLMKQALEIYEAIESPKAEGARNALKKWGAL